MVIFIYDVTSEVTFANTTRWLEGIKQGTNTLPFTGILLANKTDLTERRVISPKAGQELAKTMGLMYFECSAVSFHLEKRVIKRKVVY